MSIALKILVCHPCRKLCFGVLLLLSLVCLGAQDLRAEIAIVSYHLRDRAVSLDSLVMRKRAIFAFRSSVALSELKGSKVIGKLSCQGRTISSDTTYLFDQAAGNLGFPLPFHIPESDYRLDIRITTKSGNVLDSYSGTFLRKQLRPYFKRGINFWDFTEPYAHLECAGYGKLSYSFVSERQLTPRSLTISARMASDNSYPAIVNLALNGVELGEFTLPAPSQDTPPRVVVWNIADTEMLSKATLNAGENTLAISVPEELNTRGMGIRIFGRRNGTDKSVAPAVPIVLSFAAADGGPGRDSIVIQVWGEEGEHINTMFSPPDPEGFSEEVIRAEQEPYLVRADDVSRGYVVFKRSWLSYVYPWTVPAADETVDSLAVRMARGDFEPLTLSLYPLRDLGAVALSLGDLRGPGGVIPAGNVTVHVVKTMKVRSSGAKYRQLPRLLDRTDRVAVPIGYTTRFWLTLHAGVAVAPGTYHTKIRIEPRREPATEIPLAVTILPITLEPVPGIEYSMFMTYEFFELESKDWTASEREKIYRDGVNVFRDFRDHGLTTVDVSSPYYFQWNEDGTPRMEHFKGMIRGAKETGFKGPIYWYYAHYVQAAKKQHPGSVLLYDAKVHPGRSLKLVKEALKLSRELNGPEVIFVPIDEPRVAARQKITLDLLKSVKKVKGARPMASTDIGGKLLDIENNSTRHRKKLGPGEYERKSERKVWEYHNGAINCFNPGFSRYLYGYYTWRQDLDGMNSWGFNTAENSRGNPYEDLDHAYSDWNLAYPHPGRPLPSPQWEALREGIDDVRYVYQLEKLIGERAASYSELTSRATQFLNDVRAGCDIDERAMAGEFGQWTPERYEQTRERVIGWILKLQGLE